MKKRMLALFLAALLLISTAALAEDMAADTRVFDYAGLFSPEDTEMLQAEIIDFQENTGYDFAILVTAEDTGYGDDYSQLTDDFANAKALGLGMNTTLILCYLDLSGDAYYYISVYGDLKNLMMTEDLQYLRDSGLDFFSEGKFVEGFVWTMQTLAGALHNIGMAASNRVFDYGELLTAEEKDTLDSAIADFRALSGYDFVYLSTQEMLEGNEDGVYMEEFYNKHGFGAGDSRTGVIIYLDKANGSYYIQNFGDMDTYVSQETLNEIMELSNPLMGTGEIAQAVLTVIEAYSGHFQ